MRVISSLAPCCFLILGACASGKDFDGGLSDADVDAGPDGGDDVIGTAAPIAIDGLYEDWSEVPLTLRDSSGDGRSEGMDLRRLWLAHDDRFLFLRFQVRGELDLNEGNDLRIYIDTDTDPSTGRSVEGIGAEVEWRPGSRGGLFFHRDDETEIRHRALRFHAAPTVNANEFELAFGRDARPDGSRALFSDDPIHIVLRDGRDGDRGPDEGALPYAFQPEHEGDEPPISMERLEPGDLRIVTYNVLFDSPFAPGQEERFGRQLAVVQPDIIGFQEIWEHTPDEAARLVARWTGNADCIVLSRYPIKRAARVDGNLAVLLDTEEVIGSELLVVNAHLPCCGYDLERQIESDRIVSFIREARSGTSNMEITNGTPIVILGDLNLVGSSRPLETLITGDIYDEILFGPDISPDWDETPLTNLVSRQTELRMGYTWRADAGEFWPGHLDYIIYTDSVLRAVHHFVLCTHEMSEESLLSLGLDHTDSQASDHLLFAADFRVDE